MVSKFNYLLFPIATTTVTQYSNSDTSDLFLQDSGQNYFKVPFNNFGGYSPIWEGTANQITQGTSNIFVKVTPRRYGFQVSTNDARMVIYEVLSDLVATAQANPATYQPITVRDFANPRHQPIGQPYSERAGIINDLLLGGGSVDKGFDTLITSGIKFKFLETVMRFA